MKIKIYPISQGDIKPNALLIKGGSLVHWLREIEFMQLQANAIQVYPIPGQKANTIFGCFIVFKQPIKRLVFRGHIEFKKYKSQLFIPLNSDVSPQLERDELIQLFKHETVYHPSFGYVELDNELDWKAHIKKGSQQIVHPINCIDAPEEPKHIKGFSVFIPVLNELEIEKALDIKPKAINNTFSTLDRIKFMTLGMLFSGRKNTDHSFTIKKKKWIGWMSNSNNLQDSYSKLYQRNQNQIDKFLQLLKVNPKLAMQMAKQIEMIGSSRGGEQGSLNWFSNGKANRNESGEVGSWAVILFSLLCVILFFTAILGDSSGISGGMGFAIWLGILFVIFMVKSLNSNVSGGEAFTDQDRLSAINKAYRKQAEVYKQHGDYREAARIYFNLVKDYYTTAKTLKEGKHYQEAAHIYQKYCHQKDKAALCYEEGNLPAKALELYLKLNNWNAVGRMYKQLGDTYQTRVYLKKDIDDKLVKNEYIQAAYVYKDDLNNTEQFLNTLKNGWVKNVQSTECLKLYFEHYKGADLNVEIQSFYKDLVSSKNSVSFLKHIKTLRHTNEETKQTTRKIAYEIVSTVIKSRKGAIHQLLDFNEDDADFKKDMIRFKNKK